jgi:hypothetical protein
MMKTITISDEQCQRIQNLGNMQMKYTTLVWN